MHTSRIEFTDSTALSSPGLWLPKPNLIRGVRTRDAMMTYDRATVDSTGAFLVGELERLDPTLHDPLVAYTWSRDIDLREDVTVADEVASWTVSTYAATGGVNPNGKNWIGKDTNAIPGVSVDIGKLTQPLHLWGAELSYTVPELESARRLGRPIDAQKMRAIQLKWNMDVDEQVYTGDASLPSCYGLMNSPLVATTTVPNGTAGFSQFAKKTPQEIMNDINGLLTAAWMASGWARIPNEVRLPPNQYAYLGNALISGAGSQSILRYLIENNIASQNGQVVRILPVKWLIGRGAGGTPGTVGTVDRMVAYTKDQDLVRFPITQLQRTPLEYRSLYQMTTYWCRLGQVEFVYPETLAYADGI